MKIEEATCLLVQKLDKNLATPSRAHTDDAGLDLCARAPVIIQPGQITSVDTGVAVAIPAGYAGFVTPRSGLAAKYGISIVNSPGLIDPGYRGEIRVVLINHGSEPFNVSRGARIAQLIILPIAVIPHKVVAQLDDTERGNDGFGSSGQ